MNPKCGRAPSLSFDRYWNETGSKSTMASKPGVSLEIFHLKRREDGVQIMSPETLADSVPAVIQPDWRMLPATSSFCAGALTPMPMLPDEIVVPLPSMPVPKIRLPIFRVLEELLAGVLMLKPMTMLLEPVVRRVPEKAPSAILFEPVVTFNSELLPIAVFWLGDVADERAKVPNAEFALPLVLTSKEFVPYDAFVLPDVFAINAAAPEAVF